MTEATKTAEPEETTALEEESRSPLVDLDKLAADRETVKHGGKLYELKATHEFGAREQHRLERDNREFRKLQASEEELSDDDEARLDMLVDRIFNMVLVAPVSVKKKMTEAQKAGVVSAFSYAPAMRLALLQQMLTQAQQAGDGSTTAS
jgi:hypothetical protein